MTPSCVRLSATPPPHVVSRPRQVPSFVTLQVAPEQHCLLQHDVPQQGDGPQQDGQHPPPPVWALAGDARNVPSVMAPLDVRTAP